MTLELLDWRRQVAALYAAVRDTRPPAAAHQLWCRERARLFRTHPESAARSAALRVARYDPRWRFVTEVDPAVPATRIDIPTATDGMVPFELVGRVHLPRVGDLDVWWLASYGGGVWLPLRDAHPDTYAGGRYLLDTVKGADLGGSVDQATGRASLLVDLNFAYNPSCAYDEGWACPLAPPGNVTAAAVPVGELLPG